jgi:phosphoribosylanthranilate isomerase
VEPSSHVRVKICCIASVEEAWTAIRAGAAALGLVSRMPSGPGVIPEERIAEIAAQVPPPVATFLLTCSQDVEEIAAQHRRCGTSAVQLCDRLERGAHADLRRALPGIRLIQVVHVTGPESVAEAVAAAPHVDAILLDSGNQSLAVKELGGTGRVHDWSLSRQIRERIPVPLFLAGGLRPHNVQEAIAAVGPFGLDVCSGVRTGGRLDPAKLEDFVRLTRTPAGPAPAAPPP